MGKTMIWDVHTHFSGVTGSTPEAHLEKILAYANRMGVDRICLSMGLKWSYDPSPEDLWRQNDEVLRGVARFPERVFGFVYLNPSHVEASLAELDRCVRDGPMVGIKHWVARRSNTPKLDPLVRRAVELNAVILQHTFLKTTGNLPGESTPANLAELARRHPKATFICGHTGGNVEAALPAIRDCRNIYADLSGTDPRAGVTELAVCELGARRVLYGSDAGGRSFASQLAKIYGADISVSDRNLILGENLRLLLTPILEAKGMKS